ncbi:hypothetical protein CXB77_03880 [Chromatium okenii]|uniref:Uncharacterized protein n=2 Tax=Chromatium okenii TaxID=61644 RepID=A0A2S7XTQ3_9GAMM|nr:hypothetical protein CXB77_03880 [Chromatium okenii]
MRKAYANRGLELPTQKNSNVASAKPRSKPKPNALQVDNLPKDQINQLMVNDPPSELLPTQKNLNVALAKPTSKPNNKPNAPHHQNKQPFRKSKSSRSTNQPINPILSSKILQELIDVPTIQSPKLRATACPVSQPTTDDYRLNITHGAKLIFADDQQKQTCLLNANFIQGHATQCHGAINDEREIVLGLDFGTSSMKVVIGDSTLGIAFAVPFTAENGIKRYLLPSHVYETKGVFSLQQGEQDYRDLKLSLIANPTNLILQKNVIAFLAFVIRYTRSWLFHEHADKYCNTRIFWKLKIGLPVAHHLDQSLSKVFSQSGLIAWLVANTQGEITTAVIDSARVLCNVPTKEDIEIEVVPEIAAQIYGFVKSNQFDKRALNLYLMVDVGAGTVDSSLFQVRSAKAGRCDFEFFTSVVEPLGVMNLHRYRVKWWQTALQKNGDIRFFQSLEKLKFQTDREVAIPDYYSDYFKGISVGFADDKQTPDNIFFGKVREQVKGKTYWKTWKSRLLKQAELQGIPVFYCGGGMRMPFYQRLHDQLHSDPSCSWLSAIPHRIECPKRLNAPGLQREDFDRLTVAYGLSFLEVGKITKAIPQPNQIDYPVSNWQENYINKDQC